MCTLVFCFLTIRQRGKKWLALREGLPPVDALSERYSKHLCNFILQVRFVLSTWGFNPVLRNLSNTRNLGLYSSCNHTDQGDLKQHRFCVTLSKVRLLKHRPSSVQRTCAIKLCKNLLYRSDISSTAGCPSLNSSHFFYRWSIRKSKAMQTRMNTSKWTSGKILL